MFPGAKIVAVDDNADELAKIVSALRQLQLACIAYNYPDDPLPDKGAITESVRLIFLDINLIGGTSTNEDLILTGPITVLDRIIKDNNGPYALVTWSTNASLHAKLLARIKNTPSLEKRQPFYSVFLDKNDYLDDAPKLKAAVAKIFDDNPPFGALLDWERRVSTAGEKVLEVLHDVSGHFAGSSPSEKMDRLLCRLAEEAFGKKHAKEHIFEAVNEAVLPLLTDSLHTAFFSQGKSKLWSRAATKFGDTKKLGADALRSLNTSVVFERFDGIKPYRRGAVLAVPTWNDAAFSRRFGATPAELVTGLLKIAAVPAELTWVLVGVQAACDFNQPKLGPLPFLLGAIVPSGITRTGSPPKSVWVSPQLSPIPGLCSTGFTFEIMHGIPLAITRTSLKPSRYQVLGRFKDQITSVIAYEHHSNGARVGAVTFS